MDFIKNEKCAELHDFFTKPDTTEDCFEEVFVGGSSEQLLLENALGATSPFCEVPNIERQVLISWVEAKTGFRNEKGLYSSHRQTASRFWLINELKRRSFWWRRTFGVSTVNEQDLYSFSNLSLSLIMGLTRGCRLFQIYYKRGFNLFYNQFANHE